MRWPITPSPMMPMFNSSAIVLSCQSLGSGEFRARRYTGVLLIGPAVREGV
jgi:hypothetical protein